MEVLVCLRKKRPVVLTDAGSWIDAAGAISEQTRKSDYRAKGDWEAIGDLAWIEEPST
jgi:hypothetical protein